MTADQLLTTDEAAALLRVEPWTVREWAKTGRLRGLKPGKAWRFDPRDVDELLEGAENRPPARRRRRRDS